MHLWPKAKEGLVLLTLFSFVYSCKPQEEIVVRDSFLAQLNDGKSNPKARYGTSPAIHRELESVSREAIDNLSAIVYLPQSQTYLGLRNNDRFLHELDEDFRPIRDIELLQFSNDEVDLEGLAYLGEGKNANEGPRLAMVNEVGELFIGQIPSRANKTYRGDWTKIVFDSKDIPGNEGPEGLCYDLVKQVFTVAYEGNGQGNTTRIVQFPFPQNLKDGLNIEDKVTTPFNAEKTIKSKDIADIALDPTTGHLLVLSEEDRRLYEVDFEGKVYGHQDVNKDIQYEGMIINPETNSLILAAEPNIVEEYTVK